MPASSDSSSTSEVASATVSYNRRDLIVYALGVGCTDLRHVYEGADEFAAFPLFPAVLLHKGTSFDVVDFPSPTLLRLASSGLALPGARALLDAERYIERVRDVPSAEGAHTLTYQSRLLGVVPKRNGALIHTAGELFDGGGALLYRMRASAYALGATSVAASGCEPSAPPTPPPPRACDASHTECVGAQQAHTAHKHHHPDPRPCPSDMPHAVLTCMCLTIRRGSTASAATTIRCTSTRPPRAHRDSSRQSCTACARSATRCECAVPRHCSESMST